MIELIAAILIITIGAIAALAVITPITIIVIAIEAFVFQKLWLWFIVPTFHAPILSIPAAAGIILIFRLAKGSGAYKKPAEDFTEAEKKQAIAEIIVSFIGPFFILLIAWIIKSVFIGT